MSEARSTLGRDEKAGKNLADKTLRYLILNGIIVLIFILKKCIVRVWIGFIWLRIRAKVETCELGKEPWSFVIAWNFLM
jgi:hypothetical protein